MKRTVAKESSAPPRARPEMLKRSPARRPVGASAKATAAVRRRGCRGSCPNPHLRPAAARCHARRRPSRQPSSQSRLSRLCPVCVNVIGWRGEGGLPRAHDLPTARRLDIKNNQKTGSHTSRQRSQHRPGYPPPPRYPLACAPTPARTPQQLCTSLQARGKHPPPAPRAQNTHPGGVHQP
jgi:hypothetical protein